MDKKQPEHRFGWRGWAALLGGLTLAAGMLLGIGALGRIGATSPAQHKATPSPLSNKGYAYWYCWDSGPPRPHHLGGYVHGDHLCSEGELQGATATP